MGSAQWTTHIYIYIYIYTYTCICIGVIIYIYIYVYFASILAREPITPLPFEIHQLRSLSLARGPCAQEQTWGHCKVHAFHRGTCWVLPLTYFYHPKSARAYLFPQSVKTHYFLQRPHQCRPHLSATEEFIDDNHVIVSTCMAIPTASVVMGFEDTVYPFFGSDTLFLGEGNRPRSSRNLG